MRFFRVAALGLVAIVATRVASAAETEARADDGDRFDLSVQGETYVEVFRRALLPGASGSLVETDTALPIHQYVRLRARDLDTGWRRDSLDVELSAYGRIWPGDADTERQYDGDVQLANVGYRHDFLQLRLGRQVRAGGAARYVRYDGLSLGAQFSGFSVEGYGGLTALPRWDGRPGYHHLGSAQDTLIRDPDALPEPSRSGYRLGGGRLGFASPNVAELGVSFHEQHEEGELAHRSLGADGRFLMVDDLIIAGSGVLELDAQDIADARVWADYHAAPELDLGAEYLHAEPALYLSRQSVLSVFSADAYDEAGGRATLRPFDRFSITGGGWVNFYNDGERGARSRVALKYHPGTGRRTLVGLSYTRMVAVDNGYHSLRASVARHIHAGLSGTLEAHAFFYDEEISGYTTSTVYAGTLSYAFSPAFNLLWGASLAQSPYAKFDAQSLLRAAYVFDASSQGGAQ